MTSFRIWRGSNCRRKTLRSCHDADLRLLLVAWRDSRQLADAADAMERGRVAVSFPVATISVYEGSRRRQGQEMR